MKRAYDEENDIGNTGEPHVKTSKLRTATIGQSFGNIKKVYEDCNREGSHDGLLCRLIAPLNDLVFHMKQVKLTNNPVAATSTSSQTSEEELYEQIIGSPLILIINKYLQVCLNSLSETSKEREFYETLFSVISEIFKHDNLIPLLGPQSASGGDEGGIMNLMLTINARCEFLLGESAKRSGGEGSSKVGCDVDEEWICQVMSSCSSIYQQIPGLTPPPVAPERSSEKASAPANDGTQACTSSNPHDPLSGHYRDNLKPYQVIAQPFPNSGQYRHAYNKNLKRGEARSSKNTIVIAQQLEALHKSLPLDTTSSIFLSTDEEKAPLLRFLVTGPENTPYAFGCYMFDSFFPPTYPQVPPQVTFLTTGAGTVRFNPNLYNNGKVCLSLLGTWPAKSACEKWNPAKSTFLQVLISIQALILNSEPFYNEPGYTKNSRNKEESRRYNRNILYNNIKFAMIEPLESIIDKSKQRHPFTEVVHRHFYIMKDRILSACNDWLAETDKHEERMFNEVMKLMSLLEALHPPKSG